MNSVDHLFSAGLIAPTQFPDVMLDLETMGTAPNSPIIAIGAVTFSEELEQLGEFFYRNVNLQSSVDQGAVIDADTVQWWMQQSEAARARLMKDRVHITQALSEFKTWCEKYAGNVKAVKIYGCDPSFDNTILREHYRRAGIVPPWLHTGNRCFRTLKGRHPMQEWVSDPANHVGTYHNATDDCVFQIHYLFAINRKLGRKA
jgi:hypothetical protein